MRTGYTPRIVVEITIGETMIRPHNIDWSAWDNAKHGAREAMIATARSAKGTMTYSELSKQITSLKRFLRCSVITNHPNGRRVSVHWFAGVLQSLCSLS